MNKSQLLKHLKKQGFSKTILNAFSKVKRENFVSKDLEERTYEDRPLPIGCGATISQPYTIATMLQLLELEEGQKVLELGSGCGYVLALMSEIVGEKGEIYGIEIEPELAEKSKENVKSYKNIQIYNRDGKQGLEELAPFDRILISAALEAVSEKIFYQLKDKGILVGPFGSKYGQTLVALQRNKKKHKLIGQKPRFMFVPFR